MLGLGISLWNVSTIGAGGGVAVAFVALDDNSVPEDAAIGVLVGSLSVVNGTGSYAFTITDDDGGLFALDGVDDTRVEVASFLDYETATSHTIEITADNGVDDPIIREFTVYVSNVLDTTLSALTLDASIIEEESVAGTQVGAVQNQSTGSTLALTDTAGSRFALSGTNIVAGAVATDFGVAETHNITIRETHADGSNSPRDSIIAITVTEVSSASPGHASGLLLILTKVA